MDRDIIISKKEVPGYNRLVKLFEERRTDNHGRAYSLLVMGFTKYDRELAIEISKKLPYHYNSIRVRFGEDFIFKRSDYRLWVKDGLEDDLKLFFDRRGEILFNSSIFLYLFDYRDSKDSILDFFKLLREILVANKVKVFINSLQLDFDWNLTSIGRYLNGTLREEYVGLKYFLFGYEKL